MANDSAISLQTIDVLLYCTWRDANGLCEDFSCYAWVVCDELVNSINGLLFFCLATFLSSFVPTFVTTFLTTQLTYIYGIITITNIDTFYTINIELWQCQDKTVPWC